MNSINAAQWAYWIPKPLRLLYPHERWRKVAKILKLSKDAKLRLEWIIYYREGYTATQTARHYGISTKTFYKWYGQFDESNLYSLKNLEDKSKAPKRVRQREITNIQEQRIIKLRKKYIRYGKEKLAVIYKDEFKEKISAWKVQRVIETYKLYYNPKKAHKNRLKRHKAKKKKRITELNLDNLKWYQKKAGYIICLDTVAVHRDSIKRYIFTAIDKYGKVAYARMYKNKSSANGEDFLLRLHFYLMAISPEWATTMELSLKSISNKPVGGWASSNIIQESEPLKTIRTMNVSIEPSKKNSSIWAITARTQRCSTES